MTQPRLALDFIADTRPGRRAGLALAALGAFAVSAALAAWMQMSDTRAQLEREVQGLELRAQAQQRKLAPARGARPADQDEARAVTRAQAELARPWGALFDALEATPSGRVALLSVEPDARAGKLRISAEARRYADALAYVAALEAQPALSGVTLVEHGINTADKEQPLRFSLGANWAY
jgi:Tfp pilus assembly protein PilN